MSLVFLYTNLDFHQRVMFLIKTDVSRALCLSLFGLLTETWEGRPFALEKPIACWESDKFSKWLLDDEIC